VNVEDALQAGIAQFVWQQKYRLDEEQTLSDTWRRVAGAVASGPVSFMRIWDTMCATLLSTAPRRGAMMASLRCDHPDIEQFIDAKRDPQPLRHFNLSVQVTDAFEDAGGPATIRGQCDCENHQCGRGFSVCRILRAV
jgi:hypothetical protein